MITWTINDNCNFKCDYCHHWLKNEKLSPLDLGKLSEGLKSLGKDWVILLNGGEPFLETNFIELCKEITKSHFLAINTNLSLDNTFDFGDQIDPERVVFINAAVHITEREKIEKDLDAYIQKVKYLQDKGFHVIAYYVVHPSLLPRMKTDIDNLKSRGVNKVRIKMFRGVYQGKYYPASFTEEEGTFLSTFEADWPELALLDEIPSLKGKLCYAGSRFFFMERSGNLRRCSGIFTKYGNLLDNKIKFDISPKPCPATNCAALYEGIRNSTSETGKVSFVEGLLLDKRYRQLKNVMNSPARVQRLHDKIKIHKALP